MDIRIERSGNRIELRSEYSPRTAVRCKGVTGSRWNPGRKCWTYPLELTVCRELREAFGNDLRVGVELAEWARGQVADEKAREAIVSAEVVQLVNVPAYAPRIAAAMDSRPYQTAVPAYATVTDSFGVFDQPGLGKTIMTLAAVIERNGGDPTLNLVLCPKTAVGVVWGPEIRQWLPEAQVFELKGMRATRERTLAEAADAAGTGHVFVVGNIEMARIKPWRDAEGKASFKLTPDSYTDKNGKIVQSGPEWPELFVPEWTTVIVDESHRALVKQRGEGTQQRAGMDALAKRSQRRMALSGTPMRGKATNLFGTLNWLRPDVFTSYWKWAERYFKITSNGFSNYVIDPNDQWRPDGEQRLGEDLKRYGLRRTKNEVLAELPPKTYAGTYLIPGDENSPHAVWLEMEGKQAKQYATMEREGSLKTDSGEISTKGHLAEATRLKQLAATTVDVVGGGGNSKVTPILPSVKFDWIVDKLGELGIMDGEGDGKVVIASQFTSVLKLFAAELRTMGVAVHLLTGETSDKARQSMSSDFQTNDKVRVFLLNTQAGGVAITLDRANDLIEIDETYSPDDSEQVEDRIHRTSRIHNVTIHKLRVLDTIEEEIAWITAARESVTQYLLDGARGVEAAKQRYTAKAAA